MKHIKGIKETAENSSLFEYIFSYWSNQKHLFRKMKLIFLLLSLSFFVFIDCRLMYKNLYTSTTSIPPSLCCCNCIHPTTVTPPRFRCLFVCLKTTPTPKPTTIKPIPATPYSGYWETFCIVWIIQKIKCFSLIQLQNFFYVKYIFDCFHRATNKYRLF